MKFESEDAFKGWLKVNGYDKNDVELLSINWFDAIIDNGVLVINSSFNSQVEVIDNQVETPSN